MEKYSEFRDRATGIAPFLPVQTPLSTIAILTHSIIFLFRLPFFLSYFIGYFVLFHYLPLPAAFRKIALWGLIAIPGIWWVDIQLDGVKRGTLSEQPRVRVPHPGSVIAANFTSPLDALYLAAIFDPVFAASYPGTRKMRQLSLLQAILMALAPVKTAAPDHAQLTDLRELLQRYPDRIIAVLPECGTTNGKAILPLSLSLLEAPADVRIFPVSLRYSPQDVTTPVPGLWVQFFWNLLSRPTTCIRVRIAESQMNRAAAVKNGHGIHAEEEGDDDDDDLAYSTLVHRGSNDGGISVDEQRLLDAVGEALARLGRVKRVALTMEDKAAFVQAWTGK